MKRVTMPHMDGQTENAPTEDVPTYTVPEYVAIEEFSNVKHEYINGRIRAMAGVAGDTVEDYVALEEFSNVKHEYLDGEMLAMSGGTLEHSRLAASLIGQLESQLQGGDCFVFTSDARVQVIAGGLIAYPDVSICCGEAKSGGTDPLAMLNPRVLIEVTGPSTEKYDRGTKFARYQLIESLQEYMLVSQTEATIEIFRRLANASWSDAEMIGPGKRAELRSIGCEIDIDALYRRRLR